MPLFHWFSSAQVKFHTDVERQLGHHNICSLGPSEVEQEYSVAK